MPDQPNTVHYFGDYELLEEIASGGMGVVYKARQVSLNRIVALKMVLAGQLATPDEVKRFQREARAVANCDHPGIVPIYEVGEHEGRHYFTMKLIAGNNVAHHLPHFRTNLRAAAQMLAQVAHAVHHAHDRGLLHRDLKPANILLDDARRPHVTDFGLATRFGDGATLSRSDQIVGTASYMSPEQAAAQRGELSPAIDIYSLGAILYEILTGRPPFRGITVIDTLRQVVECDPVRPRSLNRAVPADLETICLKCMDRRPLRRYASAAELADDLVSWVAGRPINARPVGRAERACLWCRRQPRRVGLIGAAAALVLGVCCVVAAVNYARGRQEHVHAMEASQEQVIADDAKQRADEQARAADRERQEAQESQQRTDATARYEKDIREAGVFAQSENYPALRQLLACWQPAKGGPDYRQWEWYYLRAVAVRDSLVAPDQADLRSPDEWYYTLRSTGRGIARLDWSPDGQRLAVYDDAGGLRVWDLASGKQAFARTVESLTGKPPPPVPGAPVHPPVQQRLDAWSPDGKRLALTAPGGAVSVLDAVTGKRLADLLPLRGTLPGYWSNRGGYRACAWSPDGRLIATGNAEARVPIHDAQTGKELWSLTGHTGAVLAVAWSVDGNRLASGGADSKIKVWDVHKRSLVATLDEVSPVIALAWNPDGSRLMASRAAINALFAKGSTLWDMEKRQPLWLAPAIVSNRERVWSSDGKRLALLRPNTQFLRADELYSAASGSVLFRGDANGPPPAMDRELDRAARLIGPPFGAPRTCIVDLPNGDFERLLVPWLSDSMSVAAWSPDGNTLAMAGTRGSLHIHHLPRPPRQNRTLVVPPPTRVVWHPVPLALTEQADVNRRPAVLGQFDCFALSPDGKRLAAMLGNNEIQLWDAATGKRTARLSGHQRVVNQGVPGDALLWSPHGKYLASYRAADGTLKVWNVGAGTQQFGIDLGGWYHTVPKISWAWSPDETQLAVSAPTLPVGVDGPQGDTTVWEVVSGLRQRSLVTGVCDQLAWSPDGRLLACGGFNGVQVWEPATGTKRDVLTKAANDAAQSLCGLTWDPASRRLAWTTLTSGPVAYDCTTQKIVRFELDRGQTWTQMVWNPDGTRLAVGNAILDSGSGAKLEATPGQIQTATGGFAVAAAQVWTADGLLTVFLRTADSHNPVIQIRNSTSGATMNVQPPTDPPPPPPAQPLPGGEPELPGVGWQSAWSPNHKHVAAIRTGKQMIVGLYDPAGKLQHEFEGDARQHNVWLKDVFAWSPDSRYLAAGGTTVRVREVGSRKQVHWLLGHTGIVQSIAWSPDGRRIITRSHVQKTVNTASWEMKVWDTVSGREILDLRGLLAQMEFNADLTACSLNREILWDLTGAGGLAGP